MYALDLSLIWHIILSIYTFLILVKDNQDYLLFIVLPLLVNKDYKSTFYLFTYYTALPRQAKRRNKRTDE